MDTRILLPFNHLYHSGRTTTAFYVGWNLTRRGKRVLLVDSDPQCGLTALMMGEAFLSSYQNPDTRDNTLWHAVRPAFEGKPDPVKPVDCYVRPDNPNLFLIPGHWNLPEYDPALGLALGSVQAASTLQNLPGAFYELIALCCERYGIDYVIIDTSGGMSALNQTMFMLCDGFLIPIMTDAVMDAPLQVWSRILPQWKRQAAMYRRFFEDAAYPFPDKQMKFLGAVLVHVRGGNEAEWKSRFQASFRENLYPALAGSSMLFPSEGAFPAESPSDGGISAEPPAEVWLDVIPNLADAVPGYRGTPARHPSDGAAGDGVAGPMSDGAERGAGTAALDAAAQFFQGTASAILRSLP